MQIVTGYKGQAHISSNDEQGKNQGIFGTGSYVMDIGNRFSPTAVTANEIQIADGEGIIQGVHFRVDPGTYDTVTIENGEQGLQRKDLIVCRYTKDSSTSIENTEWVVIKGTPAASNPARPAYITGDILAGAVEADMPMYEVVLNGINLSAINPLFSTLIPQAELLSRLGTAENRITQINSDIENMTAAILTGSMHDIKKPGIYYVSNAVTDKPVEYGGILVLASASTSGVTMSGIYCSNRSQGVDLYSVSVISGAWTYLNIRSS